MKTNNINKIYLSLLITGGLFYTTNLYSLESTNLDSKVQFKAEVANQTVNEDKALDAELANDSVYNNQPIIRVKAAPVAPSSAEKMRNRRNDAEVATENKIAETIEKARLENEKKLSNSLFGGTLSAPAKTAQPKSNDRLNSIEKSLSDIKRNLFNQEFDKIQQDSDRYVGLDIGSGQYNNLNDPWYSLTTKSVLGISTGMRVEDNPFITLEGHFLYSRHLYIGTTENPNNIGGTTGHFPVVTQYNAGLALKYDIIPFVITPRLGGVINYTFRQYSKNNNYSRQNNFIKTDTHSVEAGLIVGGYIQVSRHLGLEMTYRHMQEISNNSKKTKAGSGNYEYTLLGKEGYGLFLLSVQMGFR